MKFDKELNGLQQSFGNFLGHVAKPFAEIITNSPEYEFVQTASSSPPAPKLTSPNSIPQVRQEQLWALYNYANKVKDDVENSKYDSIRGFEKISEIATLLSNNETPEYLDLMGSVFIGKEGAPRLIKQSFLFQEFLLVIQDLIQATKIIALNNQDTFGHLCTMEQQHLLL